ncbi:MAG: rRNA maturation RNase YbeY [Opitutaceae bacterium]
MAALDDSQAFPVPAGELSIVFLEASAMAQLHADFLDDPTETDVITFDGDPAAELAGEICVCADVARSYAKEKDKNFATELCLYVVHGYLHLASFDDRTPAARRLMRQAERRAMKLLADARAIPAAEII